MPKPLIAVAVVVGVAGLLLVPFHPEAPLLGIVRAATPDTAEIRRADWLLVESGGNVVVFAILGAALLVLARRAPLALALACTLNAVAETLQLLIPGRVASLTGLLTNCVGATVGVVVAVGIRRASRRRRNSRRAASAA